MLMMSWISLSAYLEFPASIKSSLVSEVLNRSLLHTHRLHSLGHNSGWLRRTIHYFTHWFPSLLLSCFICTWWASNFPKLLEFSIFLRCANIIRCWCLRTNNICMLPHHEDIGHWKSPRVDLEVVDLTRDLVVSRCTLST